MSDKKPEQRPADPDKMTRIDQPLIYDPARGGHYPQTETPKEA